MSGKGSRPRPIPNQTGFKDNWDKIFGNKEKETKSPSGSLKCPKGHIPSVIITKWSNIV